MQRGVEQHMATSVMLDEKPASLHAKTQNPLHFLLKILISCLKTSVTNRNEKTLWTFTQLMIEFPSKVPDDSRKSIWISNGTYKSCCYLT